ncbi:arylsulfatase [Abditibacteriota bacterium]|nr:arylsulfatase [Abditibacteriota bacterium]
MNKHLLYMALGLMAVKLQPLLAAPKAPPAPSKPNIVFIYADDLGYGDLSCYGMTRTQTPNVDLLAREGVLFTDAHTTSATCTPSRYSLLTGEYAWRQSGTGILPGDAGLIIAPGRLTLPAMLKQAGYSTGAVGKWHLGLGGDNGPDWNGEIKPGPNQVGFDYSFIMAATGDRVPTVYVENGHVVNLDPKDPIKISYQTPYPTEPTGAANPELVKMKSNGPQHNNAIVNGVPRIGFMTGGKSALWNDETMADTFTGKAINFIERQPNNKPFFLYFATHNVHVPRVPNSRFVGKSPMGPRGDSIAEFDGSVGEIMQTLERLNLEKNTLVILSSDNGPVVNDGYFDDSVIKLGDHKPAGPFKGGKYNSFEGGTRIPFIVRWLGKVQPGTSGTLVSQVDLLASLAALTGQTVDAKSAPDTQNQLPVFLGQTKMGRSEIVEQGSGNNDLALRSGHWKLRVSPNSKPELFDLTTDVAEKADVAEANPAKVAELNARLQEIAHQP